MADNHINIEVERAAFEAWAELTHHQKRGTAHDVAGWYYFDGITQDRWEAWEACASRRTPVSAPTGERQSIDTPEFSHLLALYLDSAEKAKAAKNALLLFPARDDLIAHIDTWAARRDAEAVPAGWREFIEFCSTTTGKGVNGNGLAFRAKQLLGAAPAPGNTAQTTLAYITPHAAAILKLGASTSAMLSSVRTAAESVAVHVTSVSKQEG